MELVVVIGILALLAIFLLGILVSNNRFYANQSDEIRAISGTRIISDRIAEFTRAAVNVLANYTYSGVNYVSDADTIVFQIPAVDASWNIISATYDTVIITEDTADPSRLLLLLDPGASSARRARNLELTGKLDTVSFTYSPGAPPAAQKVDYLIRINMGGSSPAVEYVEGSVTLRNK